ncbi:transporter substrate-binding domain-containing protein [Streptococcus loxodontisalivarius]|uniref:Cystine transport system substrate-binding protein n=1 Tax=Streptococcus loxodontisalivarius TaxID=1349415 RepID=A0ABS2PP31_9STRE|nr:transporter substrate-binding domain-containing protein [Streptococcus loxodontisalivarius]MBM7641787.1 cystine transport system substrate-binding protein [Streptococcus loxodontisalivarius]
MKKILSLVSLAAALFVLVACSTKSTSSDKWESIKEAGTLKVATSGTLYPQSYHDDDNNLTGYDVEIIKEIAKRLDLKVEFTEMGVDGMLSALNSGQVDVAGYSIEKDSANAKKFLYTDPHKYSFGSMIVRQSDDSGISSLEDLKGKKAAGASTTSYMKVAKKFGAELVIYDNVTNDVYLQDVANGRTDVILNDYYLQSMAVKALPDIKVKVLEGVYYNPSQANFAIKLGNTTLQEKMNDALADMKEDGTLTELSEKFFAGQDVSQEKDYDFQTIDVSDVVIE